MMLRAGSVLTTYRLDREPADIAAGSRAAAEKIADHDLKFLTYQGSVNKGQGSIVMCDKGTYSVVQCQQQFTIFEFCGIILSGRFRLAAVSETQYTFECEK